MQGATGGDFGVQSRVTGGRELLFRTVVKFRLRLHQDALSLSLCKLKLKNLYGKATVGTQANYVR